MARGTGQRIRALVAEEKVGRDHVHWILVHSCSSSKTLIKSSGSKSLGSSCWL
jgi:hypothetical protein